MANQFNILDRATYDRDNGQAGVLGAYHGGVGNISSVTVIANQAFLVRFVPSRNMAITRVDFNVTTAAGADDACDVGFYDSSTLARVASAGATTGKLNGTGLKSVSVTANLTAGVVYYVALSVGALGGTAAALSSYTVSTTNLASLFGTSNPQLEAGIRASAHPLPDPVGALTASVNMPLLAIRES